MSRMGEAVAGGGSSGKPGKSLDAKRELKPSRPGMGVEMGVGETEDWTETGEDAVEMGVRGKGNELVAAAMIDAGSLVTYSGLDLAAMEAGKDDDNEMGKGDSDEVD